MKQILSIVLLMSFSLFAETEDKQLISTDTNSIEAIESHGKTTEQLEKEIIEAESNPVAVAEDAVVSKPASHEFKDDFKKEENSAVAKVEADDDHGHHGGHHLDGANLSLWWILPFLGILLSIALFPLFAEKFWHHNYGKISLFWWVAFFIAFLIGQGPGVAFFYLFEVYLAEFIPFIVLLLSLFTVSGAIQIKGTLRGSPKVNTIIILIGTLLASWIGTTGAAMLLIRPILKANEWRKHRVHTVVFFIFLVANIGGSLTPLGDPPLFLGFLKGVDFFWPTTHMFIPMMTNVVILLIVYYFVDLHFMKKEGQPPEDGVKEPISLDGKISFILLPFIIGGVLLSGMPAFQGPAITMWETTMMTQGQLAQVVILLIVTFVSLKLVPFAAPSRVGNGFNWEPILEVAKLFATIFITMTPAIAILKSGTDGALAPIISLVNNADGAVNHAYFWCTGVLSSFLDNAPTYVVFFETAMASSDIDVKTLMVGTHAKTLLAVSAGAVFMGANTYIGNAPNFMVKSIAEENKVKMPSFFGYMLWSIVFLVPVFILNTFLFF